MVKVQFDIKSIDKLKDILIRMRDDEWKASIQTDFDHYFADVSIVDILLITIELIHGDYDITVDDVRGLAGLHPTLFATKTYDHHHPMTIFKQENAAFQSVMKRLESLFESLEKNEQQKEDINLLEQLNETVAMLGEFYGHYHRKEKLFFPIMERHGHYTPTRMLWKQDDQIRSLFKTLKRQVDLLPDSGLHRVMKTYRTFETAFKGMIFQEEALILPIVQQIFSEADWVAIADESEAFGYAMIEAPKEKWGSNPKSSVLTDNGAVKQENLVFGGGYLTSEEANLILNNLPLEITFVDKNSVFKYFNERAEAADMMLVRTPSSIGRNVANCHPPKSLQKVMTLIRDLKTGKRTSESMWFKKKDQYIHLTYKAIFNEDGEYLGILEYVQDIQPFFDLPREVKTGLSKIEE